MPVTPLISPQRNIRAKLELFNLGGSHKSRAARHVIRRAMELGDLVPGGSRRILEKSGGNFGVGLAFEAQKHGIAVDLVVGLSFSPLKRALCLEYGANLVGVDLLKAGFQPREVITQLLADQPETYCFTDQFNNPANLEAHLLETGPELAAQLSSEINDFTGCILVVGAGTGASANGIGRCLKARFANVRIVLNQPERCCYRGGVFGDHIQKGTAVGVMPPLLDLGLIDEIAPVSDAEAATGQRLFARNTGLYPGPSAGGNYFLAKRLAADHPDQLIVTIAYDGGEGYLDVAQVA
ncbi:MULTISPECIES: pyridoxal-phosphate dependent enzyme [unclassified Aureimonas]|uniref:pyridoxal-phosphate dependent enzyme n=1 Tax=unclassified Aureimonas TaxID=2615206 RepID=UPI0006FC8612|nr:MULTISPECIES: pyridoxal-phosphate dependent enzyme [unclassified Aureimonas]KQT62259.1 hypothetical protein ASG62_23280 [Aureimonas sp. Leaf427]KQT72505.1 hypothetical protein ASG54_18285 [Aureimonas sp. Leaf460]